MRILILISLLTLSACAHQPTAEEMAEEQRFQEIKSKVLAFLTMTPHEACQIEHYRKRHATLEECKAWVPNAQAQIRAELDSARAEDTARAQIMMNYWQNRRNSRPGFVPMQPHIVPVPKKTTCTTTTVNGTAQTICR